MHQKTVTLPLKRADHAEDLPMPCYMTDGASGLDLHAAVDKPQEIRPGEIILIPSGLMAAVPSGYELQIRPRSGLAAKHGLGILNSPGTIDSDYRGEIKIIMINLGPDPFTIKRGERIAQMVLCPVFRAEIEVVSELPASPRNNGGFGHTGKA